MRRRAIFLVILVFFLPLAACKTQEKVEIARLMREPALYEGRTVLVHACVQSSTHGRSLYACEESAKTDRLGFDVEESASETSLGQALDSLSTEAWAPALRDLRIEVELEGRLVNSEGLTKLRVSEVRQVTAGEPPSAPSR